MVAEGRIRAAGVENIAFDYLKRHSPNRVAELRVLHESPPFSGPPFVVRPGLPSDITKQLQSALLSMHDDSSGQAILTSLGFTRFVPVHDDAYDEVARLAELVGPERGP
jgi:ABC-type phosphate/phosphonate transport system substrate-binding protein